MIEQEMVFALGFFTAGLLALACLPAVWRRARRLTTRQLTQLVPLSMDEIVAERDGLRAGFAVEQRRLEQRLETLEGRRSDAMLDVGRRDVKVAALEDAAVVAAARIADLTRERDTTIGELNEVRAETGTAAIALHDLTGLVERQRWELLAAQERGRALESTIDENRASIASLETRILGLDSRLGDLDRTLDNTRAELARTVQAVGRASAERDAVIAASTGIAAERETMATEGARLKALADEGQHRAAVEKQAVAAQKVTIDEMRIARATFEAQLAMQAEAARAATARGRRVETENAALRERIAAVARSQTGGPQEAELGILRETLRKVADDVLKLTERSAEAQAMPVSPPTATAEFSLPN